MNNVKVYTEEFLIIDISKNDKEYIREVVIESLDISRFREEFELMKDNVLHLIDLELLDSNIENCLNNASRIILRFGKVI